MLVLVMTLLGILFVVGVAFLATMNFEADMISAERLRSQSDGGVEAAVERAGAGLRDAVMASPGVPFGDSSVALSGTAFAEMPGVQNSFSPIEPIYVSVDPGPDNTLNSGGDDVMRLSWSAPFDNNALSNKTKYPQMSGYFAIDTTLPNGAPVERIFVPIPGVPNFFEDILGRCKGGPANGNVCDTLNPCPAPGECDMPRVADADGDGIVDSLLVDAKEMGLSDAQLADLSSRVNPASNLSGTVSVALRVVPHGGMVNLNESHPTLIQNVFDLQTWPAFGDPPDPATGYFVHGPTQARGPYSTFMEESLLRRRGNIPPRDFQPSLLHGNPIPNSTVTPDMAWMLFWPDWDNGGSANAKFQSALEGTHRFTGFSAGEIVPAFNPDVPYWSAMMEPVTATLNSPPPSWNQNPPPGSDVTGSAYDRRHVVTTISHDDLLARTGTVTTPGGKQDLRQAMIEANWSNFDPDMCLPLMPFEYSTYPATASEQLERANYSKTCCPDDPKCRPDPLRGRLQLSLPWLDDQLAAAGNPSLTVPQQDEYRQRIFHIIHDVFLMLVQNASGAKWEDRLDCSTNTDCASGEYCRKGPIVTDPGKCSSSAPYWDDVPCLSDADCKPGEFICDATLNRCFDAITKQRRNEALVTRTAASLTANIIDYVDADDLPTRVAIRHFSSGLNCNGGANHGAPCTDDSICPGGFCMNLSGRDIDLNPTLAGVQGVYVYGLERQPFITEVLTLADPPAPPPDPALVGWSIELFNPYPFTIQLNSSSQDQYFLYVVSPTKPTKKFVLDDFIPSTSSGQPFKVFYDGDDPSLAGGPTPKQVSGLSFEHGDVIFLIHSIEYSGDAVPTEIVVDQFAIDGANIGKQGTDLTVPPPGPGTPAPLRFSMQRVVRQDSIWTAVVPDEEEMPQNVASPGTWNPERLNGELYPVLVDFAGYPGTDEKFASVFPTTGSMLTLVRHSNRLFLEYSPSVKNLSFNSWLNTKLIYSIAGGATPEQVTIESQKQIDNGRMPIFDVGAPSDAVPPQVQYAHHVGPQFTRAWNAADPGSSANPGNLNTLAWGQLLFDYFTALPLSNGGPYDLDPDGLPKPNGDVPRVDDNGLRVHGRININAAPWKVLAGLPFVPMNKLPATFRVQIANALGFDPNGTVSESLGPWWAKAMAAYRDGRAIVESDGSGTGNYDTGEKAANNGTIPAPPQYGRGWTNPAPMIRRGTGFMSVGELANVRHPGATPDALFGSYRFDLSRINENMTDNNTQDFVGAAAVLIALGDWVSVRSHVFTVYGQIRGADDLTIPDPVQRRLDTDARAIRFQETIDRLPVLQGQPRPQRIGQRTVGKYTDVNND